MDKLPSVGLQLVVAYAPKVVEVQRVQEPENLDLDLNPKSFNRSGFWSTNFWQTGSIPELVQILTPKVDNFF